MVNIRPASFGISHSHKRALYHQNRRRERHRSVKANAPNDAHFHRKTAKDDSPYFVLVAKNGQTLGKSEMYSSTSAMENGIASVKTNAPAATTKDLTT